MEEEIEISGRTKMHLDPAIAPGLLISQERARIEVGLSGWTWD
jgi:hypothetical protein